MPQPQPFKFDGFVQDLCEKKHNLKSDKLKLALCASENPPASSHTKLSDLKEIDYQFCGDRDLSTGGSSQTGGLYHLKINDKNLTSSGGPTGPFRYVVIYNDTSDDKCLIGYHDYGKNEDQTIKDGDHLIVHFDPDNGGVMVQAMLP